MEKTVLKENKDEWKKKYDEISLSDQLLDLSKQSPENFIDDLKMKYLENRLPNKGTIIEVGAGSGRLLTRIGLKNKKYKLIGIDYENSATVLIKKNIEQFDLNGTSICADVFCIPIKSNSVDVVVSGGLLEHFNKDEINSVIQEMVRILKPNGFFYSDIVPHKISLCRPIILSHRGGYENSFSIKQWKTMFNENELKNINIFSGLILPPAFYNLFRNKLLLSTIYKFKNILHKLDNTIYSDVFGFEYYVFAYKNEI